MEAFSVKQSDAWSDSLTLFNGLNLSDSMEVSINQGRPVSNWILSSGFWNDTGIWDDTAVWKDS